MAKWINRHPRLWIWAAAVLVAAAGGAGVWGQFSGAWLACVVIAIAAVWGRYAAAAWEGRSAARELEEHCDPEPMLASSRELRSLCRPTRARERNVWLTYAASEFTALYELGRMDEAEALLTEMEAWTGRPISLLNQTAFAMQKAVLYLRKQKPDAALHGYSKVSRPSERSLWDRTHTIHIGLHWKITAGYTAF